jgi:hypothetical protein
MDGSTRWQTFRQFDAVLIVVYTKLPSPKPLSDTGYMLHQPGGMLYVGKVS